MLHHLDARNNLAHGSVWCFPGVASPRSELGGQGRVEACPAREDGCFGLSITSNLSSKRCQAAFKQGF